MKAGPDHPLPPAGSSVSTACGGQIILENGTPRAFYRGAWTFFCLLCCKEDFERNPLASCLDWQADRLLEK